MTELRIGSFKDTFVSLEVSFKINEPLSDLQRFYYLSLKNHDDYSHDSILKLIQNELQESSRTRYNKNANLPIYYAGALLNATN